MTSERGAAERLERHLVEMGSAQQALDHFLTTHDFHNAVRAQFAMNEAFKALLDEAKAEILTNRCP